MNDNEVKHLQALIRDKKARLHQLELKEARYGLDVPPHVPIEIEELRGEIESLQTQLDVLEKEQKPEIERLYEQGIKALVMGEWEKAIVSFQQVIDIDPYYKDAAFRLEEARRQEARARLVPTPAQPRRPVNWERVGAIGGVIAVLIALGTWLIPNAADFLSTRLFETPTVTPTSSSTPTPAISTTTPTSTPSPPTATPTFTLAPPTPTPTIEPDAVVKAELLSLRSGPGVVYDILEVLKEGDLLTVEGRNLEGDWLKVIASGRREGWTARSPLQVNVDMASVPVIQAPPTPTSVYTLPSTVAPTPELLPPPVLIGPENGAICEGRVFFEWQWDRFLGQNEFFSFRVREEGKTVSCFHAQVAGLRLSVSSLDPCSEGKLYWGVAPVRRVVGDCSIPDEECWQKLSEPSEERWIYYIPGEEPWMWLPTPEVVPSK